MKKTVFLLLSVSLLLSSCKKDITAGGEKNQQASGITEFTASVDETLKTTIEGVSVSWNEGDAISVFDENGTNFKFTATASGKTVTFSKASEGELQGSTFYAVYPYNETFTCSEGVINAKTHVSYNVDESGFTAAREAIMVAKTTDETLNFKNICSLLKFEIPANVNIAKIYFYAGGADLGGTVSVGFNPDGTPVLTAKPTSSDGITIMAKEGSTIAAGTYYLPIIPNTFNNLRIKITYETLQGSSSEAFTLNQFTTKSNSIYDLGKLYDGRSWYKFLTFEDEKVPTIFNTDNIAKLSIVDNPVKGNANGSLKCMKVRMETSGSGYITVSISGIPQSIRKNITGIVFHYKPASGTKYCPRVKINGTVKGPLKVGNNTSATGEFTGSDYQSKLQADYWNQLTFKASQYGKTNFEDVTTLTISPMLYSSGNNNTSVPAEVLIDNVGFCFD